MILNYDLHMNEIIWNNDLHILFSTLMLKTMNYSITSEVFKIK